MLLLLGTECSVGSRRWLLFEAKPTKDMSPLIEIQIDCECHFPDAPFQEFEHLLEKADVTWLVRESEGWSIDFPALGSQRVVDLSRFARRYLAKYRQSFDFTQLTKSITFQLTHSWLHPDGKLWSRFRGSIGLTPSYFPRLITVERRKKKHLSSQVERRKRLRKEVPESRRQKAQKIMSVRQLQPLPNRCQFQPPLVQN
jgi:hypothetical protein